MKTLVRPTSENNNSLRSTVNHYGRQQQAGRSVPSTPSTSAQHEPTTQVPADTKATINSKIDQAQYLTTTTLSRDVTGLQVGAEHTKGQDGAEHTKGLGVRPP